MKRLRWLAVLIPATLLTFFELLRSIVIVPLVEPWLNAFLAIVIIITGSYLFSFWVFGIVEQMAKKTEQQAERAHALLEIAQAINSSMDVKTILQRAVDLSRDHLGASYGEMHFVHKGRGIEGHGVRFSGLTPGSCPVRERPTLAGLNGEVLRTEKPIRLADRREHPASIGNLPEGHPPIGAFIGVPILIRGKAVADLLLIRSPKEPPFSQDDEEFLLTVAHQTAVAIEKANLYDEVYHVAALEERNRLAHEMHDGFAQTLGYLNLRLHAAEDYLHDHRESEAMEIITDARQVVKDTYEEVRRTIFDLRSSPDENLGFISAIENYLYEFGLQTNIITEFVSSKNPPTFPPDAEVQLIRIIQEALANVRKHAQAEHVWVRLISNQKEQFVIVEDDGCGFNEKNEREKGRPHFGLQIMRERAESIGGQLSIEPRDHGGTRIVVRLPFASHQERRVA